MRRIVALLLLFPILVSFQCEDEFDTGFETQYVIQNELNRDLYLLNERNSFVSISAGAAVTISSILNPETSPIAPSESGAFQYIRLYALEGEDYILVFTQDPVDDSQWVFEEPSVNRYEYTLFITAAILD